MNTYALLENGPISIAVHAQHEDSSGSCNWPSWAPSLTPTAQWSHDSQHFPQQFAHFTASWSLTCPIFQTQPASKGFEATRSWEASLQLAACGSFLLLCSASVDVQSGCKSEKGGTLLQAARHA